MNGRGARSISPSGTQGRADGCHHASENGRKDKCEKSGGEESHRCRTPSNRFDFFTAVISPLVPEIERPPCRRTFITLPNSPLPSSPISTNSRSNLPGCAYVSREAHNPFSDARLSCAQFSCSEFCSCPQVACGCGCGRRRPVGEARVVAVDASDELDAVLLSARWFGMLDLSGESLGGIRGGGSCQPVNYEVQIH